MYTLGGPDAGSFSIVPNTGQLQTDVPLDYETKNAYIVTITVTYTGGLTDTITVIINVTEGAGTPTVNNPPAFEEGEKTDRSILLDTSVGENIGEPISATDPDGDALIYSLSGTDASSFGIVNTTGQLQIVATFDQETSTVYTVVVSVSDGRGGSDTITVTITYSEKKKYSWSGSRVAQDRIIFNEIHNAEDDKNDWIELKNISDEEVSLTDWEVSIVIESEPKMVRDTADISKDDMDVIVFPNYILPPGGILLIVNTGPSETDLIDGQDITDPESDPNILPRYIIVPEMKLPDVSYMLILRSVTDKNGKPEALEDMTGNYFRNFAEYNTQVWPLLRTARPANRKAALLTQGKAWKRVDTHRRGYIKRGYTKEAWMLSGYQSGVGYKPEASIETSLGTPGYPNGTPVDINLAGRITFSELMYATNGGLFSQPQWIELYNNMTMATESVNLADWKLAIEVRDSETHHRYSVLELEDLHIDSNRTVLLVTRGRNHTGHLSDDQIYNFYEHHTDALKLGLWENAVLSASGFSLKLFSPDGTLVDSAGNLDGKADTQDTPVWELPSGRTEDGDRTSLIRKYKDNVALDGTAFANWTRAADMALTTDKYYGHQTDISTPGYRSGGAAPVMLSHFSAKRTKSGVVVKWTTISEIDNAGFNILRSQTKVGQFMKVNPTLILGAGTTAERNTYTWVDTTVKSNVAYYYQIEDVSFSGNRRRLATTRMRGHISARSKLATTWGSLKVSDN